MKNQQLKDQTRRKGFSKLENRFFIHKGSSFLKKTFSIKTSVLARKNICRIKNRCIISYRDRCVFRQFKMTRGILRQYASFGLIPGLAKSSW